MLPALARGLHAEAAAAVTYIFDHAGHRFLECIMIRSGMQLIAPLLPRGTVTRPDCQDEPGLIRVATDLRILYQS